MKAAKTLFIIFVIYWAPLCQCWVSIGYYSTQLDTQEHPLFLASICSSTHFTDVAEINIYGCFLAARSGSWSQLCRSFHLFDAASLCIILKQRMKHLSGTVKKWTISCGKVTLQELHVKTGAFPFRFKQSLNTIFSSKKLVGLICRRQFELYLAELHY